MKFVESVDDLFVPGVTTFVNPFSYKMLSDDGFNFQRLACLGFDGISGVLLGNLAFGQAKIVRTSFDFGSLAVPAFERLNRDCAKVSLCGTTEESIHAAVEIFKRRYPNINFVTVRNGYFSSDEEKGQAAKEIVESGSVFALIGMGARLQESFAFRLMDAGYKGSVVTCGGFLHQTSMRDRYYPAWVNRLNLRFVVRIIDEPKLLKRYLLEYPGGMVKLFTDALRRRRAFCSEGLIPQD